MNDSPKEILDTMLGYLGFVVEIEEIQRGPNLTLQVHTNESEKLIGRNWEVMEELQFLLNRLLQLQDKDAPKVQVDIEHCREMRDDSLVTQAKEVAETVKATGQSAQLEPMNSYQRRIVHNAFKDDPEIQSSSPSDQARLKRITLRVRS